MVTLFQVKLSTLSIRCIKNYKLGKQFLINSWMIL